MVKGIYIHVPFCSLKCPYCDFVSIEEKDVSIHKTYIKNILKELDLYLDKDYDIGSVYVGGGTPSLLSPDLLSFLIESIHKKINLKKVPEISVEVNPENYSFKDFKVLKESGINRVSIGAQSFLAKNLRSLGRGHSPEDIFRTIDSALKAGIKNINLDMIYGISGQSLKDLEEDLEVFTSLPVNHISAYMLTAYKNTPLGVKVKKGKYFMPDGDQLLKMFKIIDEYLEEKGFHRYEISNWAKEGYECRHNLLYWEGEEFLGLGVSAWSYIEGIRFGNTKNLVLYNNMIDKGKKPVEFYDLITPEEERKERIFLGMRLKKGIELDLVKDKMDFVNQIIDEGFAKLEKGRLVLTQEGVLVSNYISSRLI